jgi:hypothetical protein
MHEVRKQNRTGTLFEISVSAQGTVRNQRISFILPVYGMQYGNKNGQWSDDLMSLGQYPVVDQGQYPEEQCTVHYVMHLLPPIPYFLLREESQINVDNQDCKKGWMNAVAKILTLWCSPESSITFKL